MIPAPKPGIYENVSFEEYRSWNAQNWSLLRKMGQTPADYHHAEQASEQEEEDYFAFGRLFHTVLLEPGKVKTRYAIEPMFYPKVVKKADAEVTVKATDKTGEVFTISSGRGAARKQCIARVVEVSNKFTLAYQAGDRDLLGFVEGESAVWTKAANYCSEWADQQTRAGREVVSMADMERAALMAGNLTDLPDVQAFLHGAKFEVSIVWTDPMTGLLCKARVDVMKNGVLGDAKSLAVAATWENFSNHLLKYGYAGQAGFYLMGYKHAGGTLPQLPKFSFLVSEKESPTCKPAVYDLYDHPDYGSYAWLEYGKQLASKYLQQVAYHRKHNFWPGHNPGPDGVTIPMECEVPEYLQGRLI